MKILLDDIRYVKDVFDYSKLRIFVEDGWIIVRNYNEFIKFIQESDFSTIEFISFDHDLADEHYIEHVNYDSYKEKTGYECVKWLVEYCIDNNLKFPEYYVHSMNPVGKNNIISYIEQFKKIYKNNNQL